jgi:hypothetical protein
MRERTKGGATCHGATPAAGGRRISSCPLPAPRGLRGGQFSSWLEPSRSSPAPLRLEHQSMSNRVTVAHGRRSRSHSGRRSTRRSIRSTSATKWASQGRHARPAQGTSSSTRHLGRGFARVSSFAYMHIHHIGTSAGAEASTRGRSTRFRSTPQAHVNSNRCCPPVRKPTRWSASSASACIDLSADGHRG